MSKPRTPRKPRTPAAVEEATPAVEVLEKIAEGASPMRATLDEILAARADAFVIADRIGDKVVHAFDDDGAVGNCSLHVHAVAGAAHGESAVCPHGYQAITPDHPARPV